MIRRACLVGRGCRGILRFESECVEGGHAIIAPNVDIGFGQIFGVYGDRIIED